MSANANTLSFVLILFVNSFWLSFFIFKSVLNRDSFVEVIETSEPNDMPINSDENIDVNKSVQISYNGAQNDYLYEEAYLLKL